MNVEGYLTAEGVCVCVYVRENMWIANVNELTSFVGTHFVFR